MGKFDADDVFVVGYPKSGNTWFQCLIVGVIHRMLPSYMPDRLVQALVPDVHYNKYYSRYTTPTFFKSHHLPQPQYRHVVYLLRDGRDVMVSYYFYLKALGYQGSFLQMVRDGKGLYLSKWHQHVLSWEENPYHAKIITIKYENLIQNPCFELKRFCQFVGLERDDTFLKAVTEQLTFSKMQKREMEQGWSNPAWPRDKLFVRRGVVGSFQDEMPPDVLQAFMTDASDTLKRTGYLT
jgi:hypothetical protein